MKTVEIYAATNIVKNVFRPVPGTPFDPAPGVVLLSVSDDIDVYAGLRHVDGSNPPQFEEVPESELPAQPQTQTDALNAALAALDEARIAVEQALAKG
jgi:hypothetical protein